LKDGGENEMNENDMGPANGRKNDDEGYQRYKLFENLQAAISL